MQPTLTPPRRVFVDTQGWAKSFTSLRCITPGRCKLCNTLATMRGSSSRLT